MMVHRFRLSDLVPDAALANPDAVAASCEDLRLTWQELDTRVGTLAAALLDSGVRPGDRIGIYLHKSLESLVAVHGVLRAGAAYVPIDPMAPPAAVASIVEDCGITVVVTHEPRRSGVDKLVRLAELGTVIGLDDPLESSGTGSDHGRSLPRFVSWEEVAAFSPVDPVPILGDDLAYVMYTSGSTGTPKGIMHTHRSGLSYATMSAQLYGLGRHDRVANFSPLHFDMSTFEILAGVSAGARVVLIPEPHLRLPASLTQYLADQGCTTLYTVPSLFQQLLTRGGLADHDLSAVRWVLPAGEVFPPEPLRELMALFPRARFSNVYGPAEVNQCTFYHFGYHLGRWTDPPEDEPLPIGHACPDAELLIIDENDEPVLDDGRGELLVRTATMMAGYWNRPDLDRQSFLDLNGPDGRTHRWYRTGDIVSRQATENTVSRQATENTVSRQATENTVSRQATGALRSDTGGADVTSGRVGHHGDGLRYHGRSDNQVKIRGNRVELEMVEAAVCSLDAVEQAVVGIRAEPGGDSRLVAWFVASGDDQPSGWRQQLAARLPAYALPGSLEPVDSFPLTPSGKIDRRSVRTDIAEGPPPDPDDQTTAD